MRLKWVFSPSVIAVGRERTLTEGQGGYHCSCMHKAPSVAHPHSDLLLQGWDTRAVGRKLMRQRHFEAHHGQRVSQS